MRFFLLFFSFASFTKTILIDPGHGGYEVGAKIKHNKKEIYEKDLTLTFANLLKEKLRKHHNIILTRTDDKFYSLEQRAKMAQEVKADLFISLHFNASKIKSVSGAEIFYLDNHKNKAVAKIESLENSELHQSKSDIVNKILIDLAINLNLDASKEFASIVHSKLKPVYSNFEIKDRGLKPGLFFVLALSKTPGILVEIGFISNAQERKKILTSKYLDKSAEAITLSINKFFLKKQKL